jgi:hypothetical protein
MKGCEMKEQTIDIGHDLADTIDTNRTVEINGRSYRARTEPDEDASINDYEGDGRTEWSRRSDGHSVRPDGFTGRARILIHDRFSDLWWEPPGPDIIGPVPWDQATLDKEASRVGDLCEYGFVGIILERLEGEDAYHQPIVADVASLWGIEWDADDDDLAEILSDLLAEINA